MAGNNGTTLPLERDYMKENSIYRFFLFIFLIINFFIIIIISIIIIIIIIIIVTIITIIIIIIIIIVIIIIIIITIIIKHSNIIRTKNRKARESIEFVLSETSRKMYAGSMTYSGSSIHP